MSVVQIRGADELRQKLKTMDQKIARRVIRFAVARAAKVYRDGARKRASSIRISASGRRRLARAIRLKSARGKPGEVIAGIFVAKAPKMRRTVESGVKVQKRAGKQANDPRTWWKWFEKGTKPRYRGSRSKAAKAERAAGGGKGFSGQIEAQPFMQPTFAEDSTKALDTLVASAKQRLEKELAKK